MKKSTDIMKRGTVLSFESIPGTPGAHPAGPPPYYRWRQGRTDPREELKRIHAIAGTMGVAIFEVVLGKRPAHQLARWVHPVIVRRIQKRAEWEAGEAVPPPSPFGNHRFDGHGLRPQRVRAIPVAPEEYEASVVVEVDGRCRALALRIHKPRGQWQIIEAEIG